VTEPHHEANRYHATVESQVEANDERLRREEEESHRATLAREARARSEERKARVEAERAEEEARRTRFQLERDAQAARHADEMRRIQQRFQPVRTPSRRTESEDRDQLETNPDETGPVDPEASFGRVWAVTGRQMGERMENVQVLPPPKVSLAISFRLCY
jgi:hypothetical protein